MGIFDSIGEIFGAGGGGGKGAPPSYQSVGLDEGTKKLLENQQQRAGRTNEQFANDITNNTGAAQNAMLSDSHLARQNAALGVQDDEAMRAAIQGRSKRYFDTTQANIGATAKAKAPLMKYDATSAVASDLMAQQQNFNHNVMQQNQAKMQKVMARNNAINSIFGGIGSLASMGMAAKPGGGASNGSNMGGANIGQYENSNFEGGFAGMDASSAAAVG